MRALDDVEHFQPIKPGALQPDIQHDQMRPPLLDGLQCLIAIACKTGAVPLVFQDTCHQFANVGFVVDDQDIGCHWEVLS